jgi:signal peptidase I
MNKEPRVSKPRFPRLRRFVREHVVPFAIMAAILGSFRSAVADWNIVPSGSMNPTIIEGDRIFVNKLAYGLRVPFTTWYVGQWAEPARGEVVIFRSPADGERLVKRVVAVAGETVELVDNQLFINGQPATYRMPTFTPRGAPIVGTEQTSGGIHPLLITPGVPSRRNFGPVTVPAGHCFVLGDNRDNSADSRYIGFVPYDYITGRSSTVLLSLDPDTYAPRWSRTFSPLQ